MSREKTQADYQSEYIKFLESALESSLNLNKTLIDRHPRELSDKEVMELAEYHGINDWLYETSVTDFARAILKKASEK